METKELPKAGLWGSPSSLEAWQGEGVPYIKKSRKIKGKGICHGAISGGTDGLETWKVLNLDESVREQTTQA